LRSLSAYAFRIRRRPNSDQVRFGNDFRTRRPQHRFRHHERPHRRSRCGAGRSAPDDIRRLGERWCLEILNGGALTNGFRQAAGPVDWRRHDRSKEPKVVWVGTGEAWTRNSTSIGDGVYKSTDGGENWTNMGLKNSERIAKILVDPNSDDTVYVCAPGKLWSDSEERGLYKSSDGGKTWTRILAGANLSTGCSMVSMDRHNPRTIYAGMWDFRRQGWTFRSGGDGPDAVSGSGLFKSTDGGASWTQLDEKSAQGLPRNPGAALRLQLLLRKPGTVYAFIEAEIPKDGLIVQTITAEPGDISIVVRHDLAAILFRYLIVDQKTRTRLQSRRFTDREQRRRRELQQYLRRGARRLSTTFGSIQTIPTT